MHIGGREASGYARTAVTAHRYVLCDVFAQRPLEGNALCVFTDARNLDEARMQALARELNLSETAFVLPPEAGGHFRLRIFTPSRELPFAGHPVIGTAVVLGRVVPIQELVLETGAGLLTVRLVREEAAVSGAVMQQPAPTFSMHPAGDAVCAALGLEARPVVVGDNGLKVALVDAGSQEQLSTLTPNLGALLAIDGIEILSVYADGDPVRVRVFCPWAGIAEDPGTGAAAGPLGVHLGRSLTILQGVEICRPSTITVEVAEGMGPRVGGSAVLVGRGHYELA
jgi:trans-2,3-dihydro-3-hydroxyanthranilate isomerase